jgi:hypothetical protein
LTRCYENYVNVKSTWQNEVKVPIYSLDVVEITITFYNLLVGSVDIDRMCDYYLGINGDVIPPNDVFVVLKYYGPLHCLEFIVG